MYRLSVNSVGQSDVSISFLIVSEKSRQSQIIVIVYIRSGNGPWQASKSVHQFHSSIPVKTDDSNPRLAESQLWQPIRMSFRSDIHILHFHSHKNPDMKLDFWPPRFWVNSLHSLILNIANDCNLLYWRKMASQRSAYMAYKNKADHETHKILTDNSESNLSQWLIILLWFWFINSWIRCSSVRRNVYKMLADNI